MAEFKPLPPNPDNADLANGIEQVHSCLEEFKKVSEERLIAVSGQVNRIDNTITAVKNTIWKAVGAAALPIIGGIVWLIVHVWPIPDNQHTNAISVEAIMYRQNQETIAYREKQNEINIEMLQLLKKKK